MEFLIEFLFELIFESCIVITNNRKVPKIIRYPLTVILISFILGISIGLIGLGFIMWKDSVFGGLFLVLIGSLFMVFFIKKLIKEIKRKWT